MSSTYTPNINLQKQGTGDNPGTWGDALNANVIDNIDDALGSPFSVSVAGSSDYTLSATDALNLYHNPTGALTGDINYIFPANCGRIILFKNDTTGSHSLTVKSSGGTGVVVPQGSIVWVFINSSGNVASLPFGTTCYQNIASATTCDIGSTQSQNVKITGTTTITSLGSSASQTNPIYFVTFAGALTLTYNATSLILPGSASITTAAKDSAIFLYLGSGNWQCLHYMKAAGYASLASPAFTGTPTAPTASAGTNTTQIATTAFVAASFAPLASPALTGNPTAPTQSTNDSSTKIATTAFVNPASSLSSSGYQKLASGLILQWGSGSTDASGNSSVTFPTAFASACYSIVTMPSTGNTPMSYGSLTTTGVNIFAFVPGTGGGRSTSYTWQAIGK